MEPSLTVRAPGDRVGGGARGVCILGRVACRVGPWGSSPLCQWGSPQQGEEGQLWPFALPWLAARDNTAVLHGKCSCGYCSCTGVPCIHV